MADAPAVSKSGAVPLDDVMLAMDVVDTLRHREQWVARELDEAGREEELLERLRQIYRAQGIDVPDRVLAQGVQALQESRFVYTPPPPGLATTLAGLWVARGRIGRGLLALLALGVLVFILHYAAVMRPRQEIARGLTEAHAGVLAASDNPAARERADRLVADGRGALDDGSDGRARDILSALQGLRDEVPRAYALRIVAEVSKPVPTALHRRNSYLVVEAVAPDGGVLTLPITSQDDGTTRTVTRWAIQVPEDTFIAVERDRRDDGVLQRDRLGEKRPGEPDVVYAMPVLGGAITRW
jgi:hypothetical protein